MFFETEDVNEIIYVSDELRQDLMNTYIEPYYRKMIVDTLSARSFYKRLGMIFETTSKLCIALSSILSFTTGYSTNNTQYFAATSGSIGCLSLGLMQVSSYAYKEHIKQSKELNNVLKKLRIDTMPIARHGSLDTGPDEYKNIENRRKSAYEKNEILV